VLWALMTFPGLPQTQQQAFDLQRQTLVATTPQAVVAEPAHDDEIHKPSLEEQLGTLDNQAAEAALRYSVAGKIGIAMESVTQYAGFDWRTNIALVGGLAAKEVVVSTLGTAYSLGEIDPEETASLADTLANDPAWNPIVALSLIIFTIFYAPCFVTVVCIAREAGSWKWGAFSIIFNTTLAFGLSVLVYQIGSTGIFGG